jgi:hypothetical protein
MKTTRTVWNRTVFARLVVFASVLALGGCEDGLLAGLFGEKGEANQGGGGVYVPAMPAVVDPGNLSIREKFGIKSTSDLSVTEAFSTLHTFIQAGGLNLDPPVIRPGDYIDLARLQIEEYDGAGGVDVVNLPIVRESDRLPYPKYEGGLLRLIVAGVNSFHSRDEYKAPPENDAVPHVVFHFQNIPMSYPMELCEGLGYAETMVRRYLAPVEDAEGSGVFLRGLIEAGVPEEFVWAPTRYITERGEHSCENWSEEWKEKHGFVPAGKAQTIRDKVWLPTYHEVNGSAGASGAYYLGAGRVHGYPNPKYETAENQAKLDYYYEGSNKLVKHGADSSVSHYWLASPGDEKQFCFFYIHESGGIYADGFPLVSGFVAGIAPAFCVR